MKIEIEKRDDLPSGIEEYVRKRAKRLAKYLKEEGFLRFVISHQKGNFFAELTLNDIGNTFHSKVASPDVKLSIEEAIEKIEHQLKRFKDRVVSHKKVHLSQALQEKEKEQIPTIKTRRIEPAILFIEDAIEELKAKESPFFVFINKETNTYHIIHKAKNGTYQILEF